MTRHFALALAVLYAAVAGATAVLPAAPFEHAGGPPFLVGPTYSLGADGAVASMCFNHLGDYLVIASDGANGTMQHGVYSSWQCDEGRPGYYLALLTLTTFDEDGQVLEEKQLCELGISEASGNRWAQSEEECPSETTQQTFYFTPEGAPKRSVKNACA